jgi:diguanylate cyclase (GGDEF)-like protein
LKSQKKAPRIFLALLTLYLVLAFVLSSAGDNRFKHLHVALDASNGILSILFAMFLWTTLAQAKASHVRPFVAIAFALAATTEIIHALIGVEWFGSYAWIAQSTEQLRPVTWPPSTYILPIALAWAIAIEKSGKRPSLPAFVVSLVAITALLYFIFARFPPYESIDFMGIQRPYQVPVLLILSVVAWGFWKFRRLDPLYEPLVYCMVFLFISDVFMLYSTSPHEKWSTIAHTGKFFAYFLMHFAIIELSLVDISARKTAEEEVLRLAHYDPLTNLPNRVLLADRMQQAMLQSQRRSQSLAVVFLDLDGFKAVNDTYGHGVGDELLMVVSQRMKAVLREGDTLARIGGDEFVAVLVDLKQLQDSEPVLNRLLRAAADPIKVGDAVLNVSASIGVTVYPQDDADADLLMRHADQAMYQAKQTGKNRYHFFDISQRVVA